MGDIFIYLFIYLFIIIIIILVCRHPTDSD